MFGEIHDSVVEGTHSPVKDSLYVITLLSKLKEIGYDYLALEGNKNASNDTHSHDVVRFYGNYISGRPIQKREYPNVKPGWLDLTKEAIDIGYKIIFIGVGPKTKPGSYTRDRAMFEEIKKEIFDNNRRKTPIYTVYTDEIKRISPDSFWERVVQN